jgi:hypothetical protein
MDEIVLALLCPTLHEKNRASESLNWDAVNRLH